MEEEDAEEVKTAQRRTEALYSKLPIARGSTPSLAIWQRVKVKQGVGKLNNLKKKCRDSFKIGCFDWQFCLGKWELQKENICVIDLGNIYGFLCLFQS